MGECFTIEGGLFVLVLLVIAIVVSVILADVIEFIGERKKHDERECGGTSDKQGV